ncbi:MAG TPA: hypothetical protein VNZ26_29665 [Vicinamibacterales bacterium]|nr:hypothetical protein [Vicinamibacterales bacterium]
MKKARQRASDATAQFGNASSRGRYTKSMTTIVTTSNTPITDSAVAEKLHSYISVSAFHVN